MVGALSLSTHSPWLDRYSTPDAHALLEALPRTHKAAALRVRTFYIDSLGAEEQVLWQGVWKWTLCYCTHQPAPVSPQRPGFVSGATGKLGKRAETPLEGHAQKLAGDTQSIRSVKDQSTHREVEARTWMSRECQAFLIPDPKKLRLCVPVTQSLAVKWEDLLKKPHRNEAVPEGENLIAIASRIAQAPETDGKRWPVWELESVAQTKAILGLLYASRENAAR